jgi:predicted lipoprotein with Yx(FWY)xxD motif
MRTTKFALIVALLAMPVAAQTQEEEAIATLYRSSVIIENARLHIATFDADIKSGGPGGSRFAYNWGNCMTAADLFQKQDGVKTRFWCEKGRYRK